MRLPYLWGGFFNYFFSVSDVGATQCLVGNALGFVPGSLLFSLLGHNAATLYSVLTDGGDTASLVVVCVEFCLLFGCITALAVHFRKIWKRRLQEDSRGAAAMAAGAGAASGGGGTGGGASGLEISFGENPLGAAQEVSGASARS